MASPKNIFYVIMKLYKNTKTMVCSSDGVTDLFEIVTGVCRGDTLALYMFIICLDYTLKTSAYQIRENGSLLIRQSPPPNKQTNKQQQIDVSRRNND